VDDGKSSYSSDSSSLNSSSSSSPSLSRNIGMEGLAGVINYHIRSIEEDSDAERCTRMIKEVIPSQKDHYSHHWAWGSFFDGCLAGIYARRAYAYVSAGNIKKAEDDLEKSIKLTPNIEKFKKSGENIHSLAIEGGLFTTIELNQIIALRKLMELANNGNSEAQKLLKKRQNKKDVLANLLNDMLEIDRQKAIRLSDSSLAASPKAAPQAASRTVHSAEPIFQKGISAAVSAALSAAPAPMIVDYSETIMLGITAMSDGDLAKAAEYFNKAANEGETMAIYYLGVAYFDGRGVPADKAKAVDLWLKAAANGLDVAMNDLGYAYREGEGVQQDYELAAQFFHKGALGGNLSAMNNIGKAFRDGMGVGQDFAKAEEWLVKAIDNGNNSSKAELAKLREMQTKH
jgi:tetratricopeptide (TPR) repeat protein